MARLKRIQRVDAVGLGVLGAITAAGYLAGLSPLMRARADRVSLAAQVLKEEALSQNLADTLEMQRRNLEALHEEEAGLAMTLESADQINVRLSKLNSRLTQAGLVLVSQQQGLPEYNARYGTVRISLQARGSYTQCAAFLRRLATDWRDMGVESIELSGNYDDPISAASMSFGLVWYVNPPTAIASAPKPDKPPARP